MNGSVLKVVEGVLHGIALDRGNWLKGELPRYGYMVVVVVVVVVVVIACGGGGGVV